MKNSNFGPISHRFRDTASYILKLSIKNFGQTAADGDMINTEPTESRRPYPMVPSAIPYGLPTSHNTFVTDGQTDGRQLIPIA